MQRSTLCALLLSTGLLVATSASADIYIGAKTGPMMIDASGVDDPVNTAVMLGYEQGFILGDVGVEAEISRTASDGEFAGNKVEVDTEALYLAVRTPGVVYFKARAGILHEEVSIGSASEDDTGASMGVGLGFGLGILQIEIEYTVVEEDIDFLSVGIKF
jgi:hypothetical protein